MDVNKMMKKMTQRPAACRKKTCFRCGGKGHMSFNCPSPDLREQMTCIVKADSNKEEEKGKGKKKAEKKKSDVADDKPTIKTKINIMKMSNVRIGPRLQVLGAWLVFTCSSM
jgi:hypothetical protein